MDDSAGEQCDDGNAVAFDGCTSCAVDCSDDATCDDGDPCTGTEHCDTATTQCVMGTPLTSGAACTTPSIADGACDTSGGAAHCVLAGCGNGVVEAGEDCDDGANDDDDDGCRSDCSFTCVEDTSCDDGDLCTGIETCDLTTHTCMPGEPIVSPEVCFDSLDNDCNDAADCADPACSAVGQCVPIATGDIGLFVPEDEPCPTGFSAAAPEIVHQELDGGPGCTGCECDASFTCSANLYEYTSVSQCPGGTKTFLGVASSDACLELPGSAAIDSGAAHVDPFVFNGSCAPRGTPALSTPAWGATMKFCRADGVGGGCPTASVCVHRAGSSTFCEIESGETACSPAYNPVSGGTWFGDYDDARTCGDCTCGESGGSCAGAEVRIWTAAACGGGSSTFAAPDVCNFATSFGYDSANVAGGGTPPTCMPDSAEGGALTPTMSFTVCCQ